MERQTVKPPFAYYGGKTTLAPVIADLCVISTRRNVLTQRYALASVCV